MSPGNFSTSPHVRKGLSYVYGTRWFSGRPSCPSGQGQVLGILGGKGPVFSQRSNRTSTPRQSCSKSSKRHCARHGAFLYLKRPSRGQRKTDRVITLSVFLLECVPLSTRREHPCGIAEIMKDEFGDDVSTSARREHPCGLKPLILIKENKCLNLCAQRTPVWEQPLNNQTFQNPARPFLHPLLTMTTYVHFLSSRRVGVAFLCCTP